MRDKLSTSIVFFLILALAVVALAGCARPSEDRGEGEEAAATSEEGGSPATAEPEGPAAGETVVSAVTSAPSSPGTEGQATTTTGEQPAAPGDGTPGAEQPVATPPAEATAVPPAPQQPPSSSSGSAIWHTVQPGETLASIARRYGTTWQAIAQANNLVNPSQIQPGDQLKIPTSGGSPGGSTSGTTGCRYHHTVQRGEWVWQIARNYGVSPYDIMAANGMTIQTASTIYSGMVLCIP